MSSHNPEFKNSRDADAVKCCNMCGVELIPGVNIYKSQWKARSYNCIPCKKKYQADNHASFYKKYYSAIRKRVEAVHNSLGEGVYFIFNRKTQELLYIGSSKAIYLRVYGKHFTKNMESPISRIISSGEVDRKDLDFFVYCNETDKVKRQKLEYKLIKQLQPKFNVRNK